MKLTGRRSWGDWFFGAAALFSLIAVVRSGYSGHFEIFANSARLLWTGGNPYGISYPSGYWFYSPSCGLFFFALFAWLPYSLGVGLYLLASIGVLYAGLRALRRTAPLSERADQVFVWLLSSEVIGCALNARLELFLTGVLLLAFAALARGRGLIRAGLALGFVCVWKFTLLPVAGLWALAAWRDRGRRAFAGGLAAGLALSWLLPMLVRAPAEILPMHRDWDASLRAYVLGGENWLGFQQLFAFAHRTLGVTLPFEAAQAIGVLAAFALGIWAWRRSARGEWLELATFGVAYSLILSPLSQSAGYLLYAPLLFLAFARRGQSDRRAAWGVVIAIAWFFVSAAYSDLVPRPVRLFFFEHAVKVLGVGLLTASVAWSRVRREARPVAAAWTLVVGVLFVTFIAKTLADPTGQDFPAFFQAGQKFRLGETPYVAGDAKAYKYAPTWLPIFALLGEFPFALSHWLFAGLVFLALVAIPALSLGILSRGAAYSARERATALALGLVAALRFADGELYNGQVNAIGVALLLGAAWLWTRTRARVPAAFVYGLGAYLKFHPLMGLGLFLRARGWKTLAVLGGALLILASVPDFRLWPELARQLRVTTPMLEPGAPSHVYQGFYAFFRNFFGVGFGSKWPLLTFVACAAIAVARAPKFDLFDPLRAPAARPKAFLLALFSLLILALTSSPLAWQHTYVVLLGAVPAAYLAGGKGERRAVMGIALFLGLSARGIAGREISGALELRQAIFLAALAFSALLLRQARRLHHQDS